MSSTRFITIVSRSRDLSRRFYQSKRRTYANWFWSKSFFVEMASPDFVIEQIVGVARASCHIHTIFGALTSDEDKSRIWFSNSQFIHFRFTNLVGWVARYMCRVCTVFTAGKRRLEYAWSSRWWQRGVWRMHDQMNSVSNEEYAVRYHNNCKKCC